MLVVNLSSALIFKDFLWPPGALFSLFVTAASWKPLLGRVVKSELTKKLLERGACSGFFDEVGLALVPAPAKLVIWWFWWCCWEETSYELKLYRLEVLVGKIRLAASIAREDPRLCVVELVRILRGFLAEVCIRLYYSICLLNELNLWPPEILNSELLIGV